MIPLIRREGSDISVDQPSVEGPKQRRGLPGSGKEPVEALIGQLLTII
jgi:hypothetical protein